MGAAKSHSFGERQSVSFVSQKVTSSRLRAGRYNAQDSADLPEPTNSVLSSLALQHSTNHRC